MRLAVQGKPQIVIAMRSLPVTGQQRVNGAPRPLPPRTAARLSAASARPIPREREAVGDRPDEDERGAGADRNDDEGFHDPAAGV